MTETNQFNCTGKFDIVFEKVADSQNQKDLFYNNDPFEIAEISKIVSVLREFQDNLTDQSYSFFTKS